MGSIEYVFRNEAGEIEWVLDPDSTCGAHYPNEKCGGCDSCMIEQAIYYNSPYEIRKKANAATNEP